MSAWKKLAAAPAASGGALNVEDVFSAFLHSGNTSTQTITNNIDLSGKGGMVWIKSRTTSSGHRLYDTERGATKYLSSTSTAIESADADELTSFNSDGFSLGADADINTSGNDYASWTWRKAPKFFDCVTYTGDGTDGREISHNLGCDVGLIIIKTFSGDTDGWRSLHKDSDMLFLNDAGADYSTALTAQSFGDGTNVIRPTSTHFTVAYSNNKTGSSHVAYLFAHNNGDGGFGPNGDQDIISCGTYTGNGSTTGPKVDVGFVPQFLMIKAISRTGDWWMLDDMRGFTDTFSGGDPDRPFFANLGSGETTAGTFARPYVDGSEQGFQPQTTNVAVNSSGQTYVYLAIRRGLMAVPTSASDVFGITGYLSDNTDNRVITTANKVDTVLARTRDYTSSPGTNVGDRVRGFHYLATAGTAGDGYDSDSFMGYDYMTGFEVGNDSTRRLNILGDVIAYTWTRANSFYDVALYEGTGSNQNITHNLGVTPEMMWFKSRSVSNNWFVYHKDIDTLASLDDGYATLNSNTTANDLTFLPEYIFNQTAPTSTQFSLGAGNNGVNRNGHTYIAYLFATLNGISKVGSYSGTGSSQNIDCGFSSGARWVMVKRITGGNGDWIVWDTTRGINSGTEPYIGLNRTDEEITVTDYIDPYSSGFTVSGDNAVGASGSTYIFYAIA